MGCIALALMLIAEFGFALWNSGSLDQGGFRHARPCVGSSVLPAAHSVCRDAASCVKDEMSRLLGNAELRRTFQPPFHNAPCADPIQFLAKHTDFFGAVVKFAELRRRQRCWLSESLDLSVDEHTDFILDGSGWGCRLPDVVGPPLENSPVQILLTT